MHHMHIVVLFCTGMTWGQTLENGSFAYSCSIPCHRLDTSGGVGVKYHIYHSDFFVVQLYYIGFFVVMLLNSYI